MATTYRAIGMGTPKLRRAWKSPGGSFAYGSFDRKVKTLTGPSRRVVGFRSPSGMQVVGARSIGVSALKVGLVMSPTIAYGGYRGYKALRNRRNRKTMASMRTGQRLSPKQIQQRRNAARRPRRRRGGRRRRR